MEASWSFNGGSALLMMLAEKVRLFERASECFTDHRDPSKVAHPLGGVAAGAANFGSRAGLRGRERSRRAAA